jgi:hypothetical protein
MVISRTCKADNKDGASCGAAPLQDGEFCYMHSPEHAEEMQEARRHGGLRKRREETLQVVYEIEGMETVPQLRRVLQIAVLEALGLPNNPARVRALLSSVLVGAKLLDLGDLADRVDDLERAMLDRPKARRR